MPNEMNETEGREVALAALDSTVTLLAKGEIDQQIATAHKYPRSVKRFRDEVLTLATLTEDVAAECSYALPRDGKTIIGPSARFAEIVVHAWGNSRAATRIVDDRGDHIVAQGAFMDLEKNVAINYEVQRRVVDKNGKRFKPDLIGVTANAACSIALRNAILKGVPKALWTDLWERAKQVAVGDATTLANKRANACTKLGNFGITEDMILAKLEREAMEDVDVADLEILLGLFTSIKEGDTTPEEAFAVSVPPSEQAIAAEPPAKGSAGLKDRLAKKNGAAKSQPVAAADKPTTPAVASAQNGGDLLTDFVKRVGAATDDNDLDVLVDESRGFVGKGLTEEQHNDIVDIAAQRSAELGGAFADSNTPAA